MAAQNSDDFFAGHAFILPIHFCPVKRHFVSSTCEALFDRAKKPRRLVQEGSFAQPNPVKAKMIDCGVFIARSNSLEDNEKGAHHWKCHVVHLENCLEDFTRFHAPSPSRKATTSSIGASSSRSTPPAGQRISPESIFSIRPKPKVHAVRIGRPEPFTALPLTIKRGATGLHRHLRPYPSVPCQSPEMSCAQASVAISAPTAINWLNRFITSNLLFSKACAYVLPSAARFRRAKDGRTISSLQDYRLFSFSIVFNSSMSR